MASNEQSVTLLRHNKVAQVEALNALGFSLTESARAADFPMYLRWGAGLLDVTIAANRRADNKKFFFTKDEWQSLSETEKAAFLLRGVRVRAHGVSFIVGFQLLSARQWGPNLPLDGAHMAHIKCDLYKWWDAYNETVRVRNGYQGKSDAKCTGAPAAEAALAYKAYTLQSDGIEDVSQWCLPTPAHAHLMFRYRDQINELISLALGSDYAIKTEKIWTAVAYSDNSNTFTFAFNSGQMFSANRNSTEGSVRVICLD